MNPRPRTLGTRRRFLALCAALPAPWVAASAVAPLPPPMLARDADPGIDPTGWLVSEKLDGTRARWDGQALWFRSGLPVAAPAWFLAGLPRGVAFDGELWMGRGSFERLSACVRRARPVDAEWQAVRLMAFDLLARPEPFVQRQAALLALQPPAGAGAPWAVIEQRVVATSVALQRRLAEVVAGGGEGLMLHRADAHHESGRSHALLKLKPLHDAEAQVLAHVEGQGRLVGRMGALRVRTPEGIEFLLGTGFDDARRRSPPPLGAWLTYTHRGFTNSGVPRFASFLRMREGG